MRSWYPSLYKFLPIVSHKRRICQGREAPRSPNRALRLMQVLNLFLNYTIRPTERARYAIMTAQAAENGAKSLGLRERKNPNEDETVSGAGNGASAQPESGILRLLRGGGQRLCPVGGHADGRGSGRQQPVRRRGRGQGHRQGEQGRQQDGRRVLCRGGRRGQGGRPPLHLRHRRPGADGVQRRAGGGADSELHCLL